MADNMATEKIRTSIYLKEDLKKELERLAKVERRSLNNLIEILVEDAIEEAKKEGKLTHASK
ncbi:hypothetical protein DO97_19675 [Neosynechococcus sphagnicola sy1]|uniref:CopG-like ribbon-helix-helix domain-containing protein n=1 Tax=Neosynechococcus sphagnicola sy1 TaxID=1497020 RepID=A0A098TFV3_9CYAN|nr:ribbon-helix-helix protein, CopG family [Neosynechococcus sphagnicola]KGF71349.1 hypothetical protein DO97_00970 [Neosynechococcus sphagnicola sy1]KGF71430.1 hypothetical protein DO97_19675 [Neosynechococcus sphagnicola sy1]